MLLYIRELLEYYYTNDGCFGDNNSSMKAGNRTRKLCLMKKAGSLGSIGTVLGGLVEPFLALVHNIILLRL
jgi:hypothetical protein